MCWKGSSDYPSNFQIQFEGCSVGRFARYPCDTRRFKGGPLERVQIIIINILQGVTCLNAGSVAAHPRIQKIPVKPVILLSVNLVLGKRGGSG